MMKHLKFMALNIGNGSMMSHITGDRFDHLLLIGFSRAMDILSLWFFSGLEVLPGVSALCRLSRIPCLSLGVICDVTQCLLMGLKAALGLFRVVLAPNR